MGWVGGCTGIVRCAKSHFGFKAPKLGSALDNLDICENWTFLGQFEIVSPDFPFFDLVSLGHQEGDLPHAAEGGGGGEGDGGEVQGGEEVNRIVQSAKKQGKKYRGTNRSGGEQMFPNILSK